MTRIIPVVLAVLVLAGCAKKQERVVVGKDVITKTIHIPMGDEHKACLIVLPAGYNVRIALTADARITGIFDVPEGLQEESNVITGQLPPGSYQMTIRVRDKSLSEELVRWPIDVDEPSGAPEIRVVKPSY